MNLQQRFDLMVWIGEYIISDTEEWNQVKLKAFHHNGWFTPEFIDLSCSQIANNYLDPKKLQNWIESYQIDENKNQKTVGVVMAGNIPLVGFHDLLCVFISGHRQVIKLSSKDNILLEHLLNKMTERAPEVKNLISISTLLKNCDAYIATGSNNSSRYFEQYFGRFPHIIRKNRTSVAVLSGTETEKDLEKLSNDIHQYFGLGCRNVTKLYVPINYDFVPLLNSFNAYLYFADHHKYKNNYDYQLAILLLNKIMYMTNGSTLLTENKTLFSPISHVFYEHYENFEDIMHSLNANNELQCIASKEKGFGLSQQPSLMDYADGIDTMQFLAEI